MSGKRCTEEFKIKVVKQVTERFAQGSQFSSYEWRDFLKAHNLQQSISRCGN